MKKLFLSIMFTYPISLHADTELNGIWSCKYEDHPIFSRLELRADGRYFHDVQSRLSGRKTYHHGRWEHADTELVFHNEYVATVIAGHLDEKNTRSTSRRKIIKLTDSSLVLETRDVNANCDRSQN